MSSRPLTTLENEMLSGLNQLQRGIDVAGRRVADGHPDQGDDGEDDEDEDLDRQQDALDPGRQLDAPVADVGQQRR